MLAYLTCSISPTEQQELKTRIQQYVIVEGINKDPPTFNVTALLQDPVLNAAVSETLRLQMNTLSPRAVQQDTLLNVNDQSYAFQKGEMVFIVMAAVHKNPEIYDNPYEFQLKRFISKHSQTDDDASPKDYSKSGVQVRKPFIWWGGGQHIVVPLTRPISRLFLVPWS
jgi:cytochrome P450